MTSHETACEIYTDLTNNIVAVKRGGSMIHYGRGEAPSVADMEELAQRTLELANSNPDIVLERACVDMLRSVVAGSLRINEQLQTAS